MTKQNLNLIGNNERLFIIRCEINTNITKSTLIRNEGASLGSVRDLQRKYNNKLYAHVRYLDFYLYPFARERIF